MMLSFAFTTKRAILSKRARRRRVSSKNGDFCTNRHLFAVSLRGRSLFLYPGIAVAVPLVAAGAVPLVVAVVPLVAAVAVPLVVAVVRAVALIAVVAVPWTAVIGVALIAVAVALIAVAVALIAVVAVPWIVVVAVAVI